MVQKPKAKSQKPKRANPDAGLITAMSHEYVVERARRLEEKFIDMM